MTVKRVRRKAAGPKELKGLSTKVVIRARLMEITVVSAPYILADLPFNPNSSTRTEGRK